MTTAQRQHAQRRARIAYSDCATPAEVRHICGGAPIVDRSKVHTRDGDMPRLLVGACLVVLVGLIVLAVLAEPDQPPTKNPQAAATASGSSH